MSLRKFKWALSIIALFFLYILFLCFAEPHSRKLYRHCFLFFPQEMKRTYIRAMAYCQVCRKQWTRRHFKAEMRVFDDLNLDRSRDTSQRLNAAQHQHLRYRFFTDDGMFQVLCRKHIIEFASISHRKLNDLLLEASHQNDPLVDSSQEKLHSPAHNLIPQQVITFILDFLEDHSLPLSSNREYSLDARFHTKRGIFREFSQQLQERDSLSISEKTFHTYWKKLRPDIRMHTHHECVCNICSEFHSNEEKHRGKTAEPGRISLLEPSLSSLIFQSSSSSKSHKMTTYRE